MKAHLAALAGALVAGLVGTSSCVDRRPFRCEANTDCVLGEAKGICPPTGYCAYFDVSCTGSEFRYEGDAGDGLAGLCVDFQDDDVVNCGVFCETYFDTCTPPGYDSPSECLDTCTTWPDDGPVGSLGCRYDAVLDDQLSVDPDGCASAGPSGGIRCGDDEAASCLELCSRYRDRCEGELDAWGETCDAGCAELEPGTLGDETGNSVACRLNVLDTEEGAEACERAGPAPIAPCID